MLIKIICYLTAASSTAFCAALCTAFCTALCTARYNSDKNTPFKFTLIFLHLKRTIKTGKKCKIKKM